MEEGKALETSKRQSRGEMGREGKRRRGSLNFMLLSLSLLLRPAARGIREDVTFILQQFPILSLPPSLPSKFHLFRRIHRRQQGDIWIFLGGSAHSLAALRQKKKRFPYQIPSSAFCAIRILQQLPPSTRTAPRVLSGGRGGAAKSFHILTTFK